MFCLQMSILPANLDADVKSSLSHLDSLFQLPFPREYTHFKMYLI